MNNTHHIRRFLNLPGHPSTASIEVTITQSQGNVLERNQFNAGLKITDCHRGVTLLLMGNSKENKENSVYKLEQIIDVCSQALDIIKATNEAD